MTHSQAFSFPVRGIRFGLAVTNGVPRSPVWIDQVCLAMSLLCLFFWSAKQLKAMSIRPHSLANRCAVDLPVRPFKGLSAVAWSAGEPLFLKSPLSSRITQRHSGEDGCNENRPQFCNASSYFLWPFPLRRLPCFRIPRLFSSAFASLSLGWNSGCQRGRSLVTGVCCYPDGCVLESLRVGSGESGTSIGSALTTSPWKRT